MKLLFIALSLLLLSACSTTRAYLSSANTQALGANPVRVATKALIYSDEDDCHPVKDTYRAAIVKLDTLNGSTASGVVIGQNKVITVAHAIDPRSKIYVEIDEVLHQAEILSINRQTDLAYLLVQTNNIQPIPLATKHPKVGESVWAAGFPLAAEQRVSTGFFEQLEGGRLYTSVHINSGTSGGGLLRCEDGIAKLAGIIHGYVALHKGGNLINIGDSTSVPYDTISDFVENAKNKRLANVTRIPSYHRNRGAL